MITEIGMSMKAAKHFKSIYNVYGFFKLMLYAILYGVKRLLLQQLLVIIPLYLFAAIPFSGIWENSDRFIEFTESEHSGGSLRVVLKTYYRYVYENMGSYPFILKAENPAAGVYTAHIRYPNTKQESEVSLWQLQDMLFSSFYTRETALVQKSGEADAAADTSGNSNEPLRGFWIEQGQRYGIFLYPQENPVFFDAFFFDGTRYSMFRYWKIESEYRKQYAHFQLNGQDIKVPKFIQRNTDVYSCITGNGSILRNYQQGTWLLETENGASYITLVPEGGGPGSHAAEDTYPHHTYPHFNRVPIHYEAAQGVFAFGLPFLSRSAVQNLSEEIKKHNSLQRPSPEPQLQADTLDFRWERIKELRQYQK